MADAGGPDADPPPDQGRESDAHALPRGAEDALVRHRDLVEDDVGRDLASVAHLEVRGADRFPPGT
ncbi:hypothetical protein ACF090_33710 [Streptomyces sp. NPDC014892]|uniref:hypothetical protein n=1 Tax=Streptomyces sp. NPDC014892 TaxID=3364930 RepID=UPI0036FF96D8